MIKIGECKEEGGWAVLKKDGCHMDMFVNEVCYKLDPSVSILDVVVYVNKKGVLGQIITSTFSDPKKTSQDVYDVVNKIVLRVEPFESVQKHINNLIESTYKKGWKESNCN